MHTISGCVEKENVCPLGIIYSDSPLLKKYRDPQNIKNQNIM